MNELEELLEAPPVIDEKNLDESVDVTSILEGVQDEPVQSPLIEEGAEDVFWVEDDEKFSQTFKVLMYQYEGLKVKTESNAEAASAFLAKNLDQFTLIILDINLDNTDPKSKSGLELYEEIRAINYDIPVAFFSAKLGDYDFRDQVDTLREKYQDDHVIIGQRDLGSRKSDEYKDFFLNTKSQKSEYISKMNQRKKLSMHPKSFAELDVDNWQRLSLIADSHSLRLREFHCNSNSTDNWMVFSSEVNRVVRSGGIQNFPKPEELKSLVHSELRSSIFQFIRPIQIFREECSQKKIPDHMELHAVVSDQSTKLENIQYHQHLAFNIISDKLIDDHEHSHQFDFVGYINDKRHRIRRLDKELILKAGSSSMVLESPTLIVFDWESNELSDFAPQGIFEADNRRILENIEFKSKTSAVDQHKTFTSENKSELTHLNPKPTKDSLVEQSRILLKPFESYDGFPYQVAEYLAVKLFEINEYTDALKVGDFYFDLISPNEFKGDPQSIQFTIHYLGKAIDKVELQQGDSSENYVYSKHQIIEREGMPKAENRFHNFERFPELEDILFIKYIEERYDDLEAHVFDNKDQKFIEHLSAFGKYQLTKSLARKIVPVKGIEVYKELAEKSELPYLVDWYTCTIMESGLDDNKNVQVKMTNVFPERKEYIKQSLFSKQKLIEQSIGAEGESLKNTWFEFCVYHLQVGRKDITSVLMAIDPPS